MERVIMFSYCSNGRELANFKTTVAAMQNSKHF
jgi:hypothetical protein